MQLVAKPIQNSFSGPVGILFCRRSEVSMPFYAQRSERLGNRDLGNRFRIRRSNFRPSKNEEDIVEGILKVTIPNNGSKSRRKRRPRRRYQFEKYLDALKRERSEVSCVHSSAPSMDKAGVDVENSKNQFVANVARVVRGEEDLSMGSNSEEEMDVDAPGMRIWPSNNNRSTFQATEVDDIQTAFNKTHQTGSTLNTKFTTIMLQKRKFNPSKSRQIFNLKIEKKQPRYSNILTNARRQKPQDYSPGSRLFWNSLYS